MSNGQEDRKSERMVSDKFIPGGIHDPKVHGFWEFELKASDWVMEVIRYGYIIPFERKPSSYEEENNSTAKKDMVFVRQAVRELVDQGVVSIVPEKPFCVSPLTVSVKLLPDSTEKKRLCWDGSRCVNLLVKEQPVKLAHLQRALEITRPNDFQVKYDLKSAYHHIKIHKEHVNYLGAAFEDENGKKVYFVFQFLPFGLSSAVHCITKLFKPINAYLHGNGIRHSIYIDDGRILAETEAEAEDNRKFTYAVLEKAGWIRETKKSDAEGQASQVKEYLGFQIDTKKMVVKLTEGKKKTLKQEVEKVIGYDKSRNMKVRELAKILGTMIAAEPALGNMPLMAARSGYIQIDNCVRNSSWEASLRLDDQTTLGLRFFLQNLERFDETPIRSADKDISVISIIGPPSEFMKQGFVKNHVRTQEDEIWASDASGFATCAYSVESNNLYYRGLLTEEEQRLSSGHRELLAVKHTLEFYRGKLSAYKPFNIYWLTDSENLVSFLTKGSGKSHIQADIFRIMMICQELRLRIIPIHLLRGDPRIEKADDGSKSADTDRWAVDIATFRKIENEEKFSIDLFASDKNSKCSRFYSNFFCPGTCGIDAFAHSWEGERAWVCPPINLVVKSIRKIHQTKMSGVLFIPEWPTADYWTEIFDRHGQIQKPFKSCSQWRPFLMQEDLVKSPFQGRSKFNFLCVHF